MGCSNASHIWQLGRGSTNSFVNKCAKHCEEKMNKDKLSQSSAEIDIETNTRIMICQVVQLRYAYGALWKHAYHLLGREPPGRASKRRYCWT